MVQIPQTIIDETFRGIGLVLKIRTPRSSFTFASLSINVLLVKLVNRCRQTLSDAPAVQIREFSKSHIRRPSTEPVNSLRSH